MRLSECRVQVVIFVADTLSEIVAPAVRAVFKDSEVSAIILKFDPDLQEGSITLSLTAVCEDFHDLVVQGNVGGYEVAD
jgi:hypothetical protein